MRGTEGNMLSEVSSTAETFLVCRKTYGDLCCVGLGYGDFVGERSCRRVCRSNIEDQWEKNFRQLKGRFQEEVSIEGAKRYNIPSVL